MAVPVQSDQDFLSQSKIVNLPTPTGSGDAAPKGYVDTMAAGTAISALPAIVWPDRNDATVVSDTDAAATKKMTLNLAQSMAAWKHAYIWNPTAATAGLWIGTAGAGAGTFTSQLPTTTSPYTANKRGRWANVATTTNQVLGQRNTEAMFMSGNAAGVGGYMFYARGGLDVWTNGSRFFAGMHSGTTVVSADPSALNNTVGFCVDAADNGAISFLTRSTSATKASTGLTVSTGKGYDMWFTVLPNGTTYYWRIVELNTGTEASGTATATLPTNTTLLTAGVLASNAALTTATATQVACSRISVDVP